jgi:hypothetical protein
MAERASLYRETHDAPDEDPTLPPPGRRTGNGSDSVVPFLVRTLMTRPRPRADDFRDTRADTTADTKPGDL